MGIFDHKKVRMRDWDTHVIFYYVAESVCVLMICTKNSVNANMKGNAVQWALWF